MPSTATIVDVLHARNKLEVTRKPKRLLGGEPDLEVKGTFLVTTKLLTANRKKRKVIGPQPFPYVLKVRQGEAVRLESTLRPGCPIVITSPRLARSFEQSVRDTGEIDGSRRGSTRGVLRKLEFGKSVIAV